MSTLLDGANLETATGKGLYWELHAQRILGGKVLALEVMNKPYDLLMDDGTRIDVKSSNVHRRKQFYGKPIKDYEAQTGWWAFHRERGNPDYYFCIGLVENEPQHYFLIPASEMPASGASVSTRPGRCKYYAFEVPVNNT